MSMLSEEEQKEIKELYSKNKNPGHTKDHSIKRIYTGITYVIESAIQRLLTDPKTAESEIEKAISVLNDMNAQDRKKRLRLLRKIERLFIDYINEFTEKYLTDLNATQSIREYIYSERARLYICNRILHAIKLTNIPFDSVGSSLRIIKSRHKTMFSKIATNSLFDVNVLNHIYEYANEPNYQNIQGTEDIKIPENVLNIVGEFITDYTITYYEHVSDLVCYCILMFKNHPKIQLIVWRKNGSIVGYLKNNGKIISEFDRRDFLHIFGPHLY